MKFRDVLRLLRDDGWVKIAQKGSHQQYKHARKPGKVTVAGHDNDDVPPKILSSILRQAGLR